MAVLSVTALGFGVVSLLVQGRQAQEVVGSMQRDGATLQAQAKALDLAGAAATLTRLHAEADHARSLTSGPAWVVGGAVPVLGRNIAAAHGVAGAVASVLDAAQPLATALPRLDPRLTSQHGGTLDVAALADATRSLPALSDAVAAADATTAGIDPDGLAPALGNGVRTLRGQLDGVRDPLANAASGLQLLPTMLGADGPRTWLVLLEQDAEARGTGGLVGAYAVVHADQGRLTLAHAAQRGTLGSAPIPTTGVPDELRDLWGQDLSEWAGLNLSPHFPWTGQLVAAGWKQRSPARRSTTSWPSTSTPSQPCSPAPGL